MSESSTPIEISLLVFPKVQQLDLTGPYEVFAGLMRRLRPARSSTFSQFPAARGSTRS